MHKKACCFCLAAVALLKYKKLLPIPNGKRTFLEKANVFDTKANAIILSKVHEYKENVNRGKRTFLIKC